MDAPKARPRRGQLILVLLASGLLVIPAAAGAAEPAELTAREQLFLEAHGPIRHVIWLELPPTVFTDERGRIVGIDADIHALMSIRLGVAFEYLQASNLSEAVGMLERGEADTISPVVPSEELSESVDVSAPYISGGIGFWVNDDRQGLSSHEDLAAVDRITAVPGAVSEAWLEANRPDLVFVEVEGIEQGLEMVRDGQADAYLGSFASVAYLIAQDPELDGLVPLGDMVVRVDAGFVVPKGNKELLSIVNKGLESVGRSDFVAIYQKWTGFDLSPATAPTPAAPFYEERWIQVGGGVGLAIVVLLGAHSSVLRRQVRSRTEALAQSEERYRGLFEHVPVGIFQTRPDGTIVEANAALLEIMGYESREAFLSQNARGFYLDPEVRDGWMRTLRTGDPVRGTELRMRLGDGEAAWLSFSVRPIAGPDGQVERFEGAVLDITARKRAELELREHAEKLASSNAELERFAYVASHDLREPIRMVHSYLQLLEDRLEGDLDDDTRDYMGFALEGAERMDQLVRDLLAYARVERETGPMAPVDLGEVLDDVLVDLSASIAQTGARIETGPLPTVPADRSQMGQVLLNLLSNALKFQPPGQTPEVRVSAEREDDVWTIQVSDNGLGVDPDYRERILEVFQRLHGREAFPGTGVGLAICKRVVERHGGEVWVESEGEGHGSTFKFTLPATSPYKQTHEPRVDPRAQDTLAR